MKILTTFTHDYLQMFREAFIPSLPEGVDLTFQYHNYDLKDCAGKFGSHDTLYKVPFILNVLETCKEGELIFYCDVDVVILNDNIEQIINQLPEKDLYIQWDNPTGGVCMGCMVLRNTEAIRNLLRKFLEKDPDWIIKNHRISLFYFKTLLDELKINYSQLPLEFYGGQMLKYGVRVEKMYLYHATFEQGVNHKYLTLKRYLNKKILNSNSPVGNKFLILLMYYNRPELVKSALQSISNLTYDNWEVSIVDDGSDESIYDLSISILPKERVKYYRIMDTVEEKKKRGGSIHGKFLNQAIQESNADIVIPLCDDDALMNGYLNDLDLYFQQHPESNYAYSNVFTFDPEKENPFDIIERRWDFGYHTTPQKPNGVLDSSQIVFRMRCFKEDGLTYPYPQTKDLDSVVFEQAFKRYGLCPYTGFYGQYKAIFKGQLGYRKNIFEYKH